MNIPPYTFILSNLFFILGILCDDFFQKTIYVFSIIIVLFLLILILKYYKFLTSILIYTTLFFIGILYTQYEKYKNNILSLDTENIQELLIISDNSISINRYNNNCNFIIKKIKLKGEWININKKILIKLYFCNTNDEYKINFGDCFIIKNDNNYGNLYCLKNDYFELDNYYKYLKYNGIHYIYYTEVESIFFLCNYSFSKIKYFFINIKVNLKDRLLKYINDINSKQLLSNLIFGKNDKINYTIKNAYIKTNLTHILSISGLHIMLIFFIFSCFLKKIIINKKIRNLIILSFIWIYGFIISMPPSVLRAIIISTFMFISIIIDRSSPKYCFLFNSSIFSLLINPLWLYSIGFLLSYLSTFGILFFYNKFYSLLKTKNKQINNIISSFIVILSVQLLSFPIILYNFNHINLFSIFINLIVIPIFTLIIFLSFLTILSSFLFFLPYLYMSISYILDFMMMFVNKIIYEFSLIDYFNITTEKFNILYVLIYYTILFSVCYIYNNRKKY